MKTLILGGGTFQPISNHLSLSAPAFGTTAKELGRMIPNSILKLTKMADSASSLITNEDVESVIDECLMDKELKAIILNVAFCDFKFNNGDFHGERFRTENGDINITLTPTEKIIKKIRIKRPDIFLVGFKTTTNKTVEEQFLIGLKMMKSSKCNLVLANDVVTRNNIIITPEESYYGNTTDRNKGLQELVEIFQSRIQGTYSNSVVINEENSSITNCSKTFQDVIKWVIENDGFIENNGNGFTPGHFCERIDSNSFYSSQRKANHNLVFQEGMTLVKMKDEIIYAYGKRKASVGARSQWLILKENPEFDCIIHTHNPLKSSSSIPVTQQKPYQCGSLECGLNTLNHLGDFGDIKAVYLDKHGANILFKSSSKAEDVIEFIKNNIELGIKVS